MQQENLSIPEKVFYSHLFNLSRFGAAPKVEWKKWGEWFGCSPDTVKRAFSRLEQARWVKSGERRKGRTPRFQPLIDPRNGKPLTEQKPLVNTEKAQSAPSQKAQSAPSHSDNKICSTKNMLTTCTPIRDWGGRVGIEEDLLQTLIDLGYNLEFDANKVSLQDFFGEYGEEGIRAAITKVQEKKRQPRNPGALLKSFFDGGLSNAEIFDYSTRDQEAQIA